MRANDSAGSYRSRSGPRDEHSSVSRPPGATAILFSRRVAPNLIACPERNSSEPLCPTCPPACCSQRKVVNSRLFRHIFQISARGAAAQRRPPTTRLVLCLGKEGSQHPPFALFQNNWKNGRRCSARKSFRLQIARAPCLLRGAKRMVAAASIGKSPAPAGREREQRELAGCSHRGIVVLKVLPL